MFVITSDVAGAEVTRSHLPRGLHSALRLEHATQQVRKILRENIREKHILDFSLRSRERSEARERAGPGEARDNTPKKSISMGQIQREGARTQDTNGNTGQDTDIS